MIGLNKVSASEKIENSFRIVFDIAGNRFRIICKYFFGDTEVHFFVCSIGTHAEYDKLCKGKKQYTVKVY